MQEHDVAVLELVRPVAFTDHVHTICLPDESQPLYSAGTSATVAGWGLAEAYGPLRNRHVMMANDALTVIDYRGHRPAGDAPPRRRDAHGRGRVQEALAPSRHRAVRLEQRVHLASHERAVPGEQSFSSLSSMAKNWRVI